MHTSAGPAFVAILGNKYGYRPFPAQIEQAEFEKLLGSLESDGADTTTLREYFCLDLNGVPPCYVLKANDADDAQWASHYEVMQKQLRDSAVKALTSHDAEKYRISVTEAEIRSGIIGNAARTKQVRQPIYRVAQNNGATLSHCKYSENFVTELRVNW